VAVKILRPELAVDGVLVQRFFNEARATSAIRHPNIVEVIDLGLLPDGIPYLVMELLEGQSLAQRIANAALPVSLAVDFAVQTASALQAAHDNHIVHRDLKPDNVFLVRDQRVADRELVKVLDFGVAKLQRDPKAPVVNTLAGMIIGTPPYMSPEQCRGMPAEIDERTDVYALGVILYEMLCGEPPFVADSLSALISLHLMAEALPPSQHRADLPAELEALIMHALMRERELRLSSMREFGAALQRVQEQLPAEAFDVAAPVLLRARPHPEAPTLPQGRARAARPPSGTEPALQQDSLESVRLNATTLTTRRRSSVARAALSVLFGAVASLVLGMVLRAPHARQAHLSPARAAHYDNAQTQTQSALSTNQPATSTPTAADVSPAPQPTPTPTTVIVQRPQLKPSSARNRSQSGSSVRAQPKSLGAPPAVSGATPPPTAADESAAITTPGHLNLDSEPWADVYLGSERLGTTPLMHVALPPGKHVLTLSNPELGVSTSYAVEIAPGKTLSRLVGWAQR
jgi:serine/threonine protein kinase